MTTKSTWVFLIAVSLASLTHAQSPPLAGRTNVPNKSGLPTSLDRQLRRDAARLALRLEGEKEDVRFLPVVISRDNINGIYKAIYNIYTTDEAGKSIARCNIHTFPNPSIDHLVVIYRRDAPWAAPLRQGITETTNKDLNQLLDQYDLAIERSMQWNDTQDAMTLRSKEPLNMAALADRFRDIGGVMQTDLSSPKLGGNDIKARRVQGGWEIDFVLSISGNKQHTWKFKATDSGQTTLLKETGEPLPDWMKCSQDEPIATRF
jgi:hypothetical protein